MDNVKNFYEMKALAMEYFENTICLELNDLEQYFLKYHKLYQMYTLLETDYACMYKEKILTNVKVLIDTYKNKIKNRLAYETNNFAEISEEYSNLIMYLLNLQKKYPEFQKIIEIDDIV